jgi:hypothetical protein
MSKPNRGSSARLFYATAFYNRQKMARKISEWMKKHDCKTVFFIRTKGDEHAGDPKMATAGIVENNLTSHFDVKMGINIESAKTAYPFMIAGRT